MAFFLTLAAMAMAPTIPNQIDVVRANWRAYPTLETSSNLTIPNSEMVGRVQEILAEGQCRIEGQSPRAFDFDVNYAVRLDPQGNASRIIVEDIGCQPLEHLVGEVVGGIILQGFVRSSPPPQPSWYASRINFNLH